MIPVIRFLVLYSACFAFAHLAAVTSNHQEDITYYGHRRVREGDALVIACFFAIATNVSWTKNGRPLHSVLPNTYTVTDHREEDGYKVSTLWVDGAQKVHSGNYSCSDTLASVHPVTVSQYQDSPHGTAMSDCLHVRPGKELELPCHTSYGPNNFPSASWYKDGRLFVPDDRSIFLNSTLVIKEARDTDAGTYACTMEPATKDARVIYATALHTVVTPIRIDPFPSVHRVYVGDSVRVPCSARALPRPNVTWYIGTRRLDDGSATTAVDRPAADHGTSVSVLSLPSVLSSHNGLYTCVASHRLCDELVTQRSLQIYVPPIVKTNEDYPGVGITLNPSSESLRLQCSYPPIPFARIRWKKGDKDIDDYPGIHKFSTDAKDHSLIIHSPTVGDVGNYTCLVLGTDKKAVILVGLRAKIQDDVTPVSARVEGRKLYMRCKVSGIPIPFVRWFKDNKLVKVSQRPRFAYKAAAGVFPDTLEIHSLSREDSGMYSCVADNGHSQELKQFQIEVMGKAAAVLPTLLICAEVAALCALVHKLYRQYLQSLKGATSGDFDHDAGKKEASSERPGHSEDVVIQSGETTAATDLSKDHRLDSLQHRQSDVAIPIEDEEVLMRALHREGTAVSIECDVTTNTEVVTKDADSAARGMHVGALSHDNAETEKHNGAGAVGTLDTALSSASHTEPATQADYGDSRLVSRLLVPEASASAELPSTEHPVSSEKNVTDKTADQLISRKAYSGVSAEPGVPLMLPSEKRRQPRAVEITEKEPVKAEGHSRIQPRPALGETKQAVKTEDLAPTSRRGSTKAKSEAPEDTALKAAEGTSKEATSALAPSKVSVQKANKAAKVPQMDMGEPTLTEALEVTSIGLEGSARAAAKVNEELTAEMEIGKERTEAAGTTRKAPTDITGRPIEVASAEAALKGTVGHPLKVPDGTPPSGMGETLKKPAERVSAQETAREMQVRKSVAALPETSKSPASKAAVVPPRGAPKGAATKATGEAARKQAGDGTLQTMKETAPKASVNHTGEMPSRHPHKTAKESAEKAGREATPGAPEEPIPRTTSEMAPRVAEKLSGKAPIEAAKPGSPIKPVRTRTGSVAKTIVDTSPKTDGVAVGEVPPKRASKTARGTAAKTASAAEPKAVEEPIIQAGETKPKTVGVLSNIASTGAALSAAGGVPTEQTGIDSPTKREVAPAAGAMGVPTLKASVEVTTDAIGSTRAKTGEGVLKPSRETATEKAVSPAREITKGQPPEAAVETAHTVGGSTPEAIGTEGQKPTGGLLTKPTTKAKPRTDIKVTAQVPLQAASKVPRETETKTAKSESEALAKPSLRAIPKAAPQATPEVPGKVSKGAAPSATGSVPGKPTPVEAEPKTAPRPEAKDTVERSSVTKDSSTPKAVVEAVQPSGKDSAAEAKPAPSEILEAVAKEAVKPALAPEKTLRKVHPETTDAVKCSPTAKDSSTLKAAADPIQRKIKDSAKQAKPAPSAIQAAATKGTAKRAPAPERPLEKAKTEVKGAVKRSSAAKDASTPKPPDQAIKRSTEDTVREPTGAKLLPTAVSGATSKGGVKSAQEVKVKPVLETSARVVPVVTEDTSRMLTVGGPALTGKRETPTKETGTSAAKPKKGPSLETPVDATLHAAEESATKSEARKQEGGAGVKRVAETTDAAPRTDGQLARKAALKGVPHVTKAAATKISQKTSCLAAEKSLVNGSLEVAPKGTGGATVTTPARTSQTAVGEAITKTAGVRKQTESRPVPNKGGAGTLSNEIGELLGNVPLEAVAEPATKSEMKTPQEAAQEPVGTITKESRETALRPSVEIKSGRGTTKPAPAVAVEVSSRAVADHDLRVLLSAAARKERTPEEKSTLIISLPATVPEAEAWRPEATAGAPATTAPASERGGTPSATTEIPLPSTATKFTRTAETKEQGVSSTHGPRLVPAQNDAVQEDEKKTTAAQAELVPEQPSDQASTRTKPLSKVLKALFLKAGKSRDEKDRQMPTTEERRAISSAKDQDRSLDASVPALVLCDEHPEDWSRTNAGKIPDASYTSYLFRPEDSPSTTTLELTSSRPDAYLLEVSSKQTSEPHERVTTKTDTTEVTTTKDAEPSAHAKDTALSKATTADAGAPHAEDIDDSHALVERPSSEISVGYRSPSQEPVGKKPSQTLLVRFFESGVERSTREGDASPSSEPPISTKGESKRASLKRRVRRRLAKVRKHRHHKSPSHKDETQGALVPVLVTTSDVAENESTAGALVSNVEDGDPVSRTESGKLREGVIKSEIASEDTERQEEPSESLILDTSPGLLVEYVEHLPGESIPLARPAGSDVETGAVKSGEFSSSSTGPPTEDASKFGAM